MKPFILSKYKIKKMKIEIKSLRLGDLRPTQGELKKRSSTDEKRILESLEENEQMYPLYAAEIEGVYQLIDGHFRTEVLIKKKGADYQMPVVVFSGMSLEDAKKQCLVLSATYGSLGDLAEWLKMELPNLDEGILKSLNMPLPNLDVDITAKLTQTLNKCPICGQ